MDQDKLDELRELVDFLKDNGIAEFDLERSDLKVRIKFAGAAGASASDLALARQMIAGGGGENIPSDVPTGPPAAPAETVAEEKLHQVTSPIVGTFYDSPSPGSPAFVKPGDQVEVGQVLCIVEAMKLMNEIESDVAGEVVKRIAVGGQPVEYGQPLFTIRPR
jgi:acetyl-CoA carboxylase biotin carboxyl carrier protein